MKDKNKIKTAQRERRRNRIRAKIIGVADRPRLAVFKSNKYIYAQIIDDEKRQTVVAASSLKLGANKLIQNAEKVGAEVAKKAQAKKIKQVVFDKGGFMFTGRIKALADSARKGGLKF